MVPSFAACADQNVPLDARGLGPIQATLLKASNALLRPCLGQGAPRRARDGRVRSLAFLSILPTIHALSLYVPHYSVSRKNE